LTLALSALQTRDNVSAQQLAQPSDRPPLFGTQTAQAATAQAAATQTAAAAVFSPPPPASRQPPPTVATIVPFPTATRPRVTRTPSATLSSTDTPTPTQTAIPASVFETATSKAATDQVATVQAIVALTSTALRLSQPAASATPIPISPTTAPPTAYPSFPQTTPAAAAGILDSNPWLWLVVAVPFIALALALWWLFQRRFHPYPLWGRPRRGSRRAGRRYVRRRSFPF